MAGLSLKALKWIGSVSLVVGVVTFGLLLPTLHLKSCWHSTPRGYEALSPEPVNGQRAWILSGGKGEFSRVRELSDEEERAIRFLVSGKFLKYFEELYSDAVITVCVDVEGKRFDFYHNSVYPSRESLHWRYVAEGIDFGTPGALDLSAADRCDRALQQLVKWYRTQKND